MTMKKSEFTLEHALYALALVLALGARFLNLGLLPLSDYEASWALQAMHVAQGLKPALDPNPAYIHLTAVLFFIFSATEFLARFWPALAGSILVLVPFHFRDRLGRLPALILAFGLALDPGLTALSREAGSSMLAIAFLFLTWAAWEKQRQAQAGIFAALALLSGPSVWFGLLGLGLGLGLGSFLARLQETQDKGSPREASSSSRTVFSWEALRLPVFWGLGTLLVAGTLLLLSPKGIPAFVESFLTFFRGWTSLSNASILYLVLSLPIYELFPLAFGIAALVRSFIVRDLFSGRLGMWAIVALLLASIYPQKQVADLAWVIIPLWILAAREIGRHFDFEGVNIWVLALTFVVVAAPLVTAWLNLTIGNTMDLSTPDARNRLLFSALPLLAAVIIWLLIWLTWDAHAARLGGTWASVTLLTAYTVGVMTAAGGLRQPLTADFWQIAPRTAGADLVQKTVSQISDWNKGAVDALPVTVVNVHSPALLWALRSWNVRELDSLSASDSPELVFTPASTELTLSQGYRGEGFNWSETINWRGATSAQWFNWILYHQMPVTREDIVLWVRGDLIIENQNQTTTP